MEETIVLSPEAAQAIHDAKNAQQSVEVAREVQKTELAELVKNSVVQTLENIFGGPNVEDPEHMTIIYQKIPILCIRVDKIDKNIVDMKESFDKNIAEIKGSMQWFTRAALAAVISGVVGLVILAASKLIFG